MHGPEPEPDHAHALGTVAPVELSSKWGFVVCGGLYYIKVLSPPLHIIFALMLNPYPYFHPFPTTLPVTYTYPYLQVLRG